LCAGFVADNPQCKGMDLMAMQFYLLLPAFHETGKSWRFQLPCSNTSLDTAGIPRL